MEQQLSLFLEAPLCYVPKKVFQRVGKLHEALLRLSVVEVQLCRWKSVERVANSLLDEFVHLSGAERGYLLVYWQDRWFSFAQRNLDRESLPPSLVKVCQEVLQFVGETGHFFLTGDAREDPRLRQSLAVRKFRLRSILCLPLFWRRQLLGGVYLDNRLQKKAFQELDFSFFKPFLALGAFLLEILFLYHDQGKQNEALRGFLQGAYFPGHPL